ncbi:uncharacterized protein LOC111315858 [Durio zibethinus]|uniref:Uncharacterized protein LOC111315858 n=1 Tax=Durio zibethinus TaxID=66656 RepID=A0A6P6B8T2_DURZI|nr:uncharacterized protein LOC111315858 [Durio zibethinus]
MAIIKSKITKRLHEIYIKSLNCTGKYTILSSLQILLECSICYVCLGLCFVGSTRDFITWLNRLNYYCDTAISKNQTSFYPFVPHEIFILIKFIFGHLHYLLIDVLPQPIYPLDIVFYHDQSSKASLGSKIRGHALPLIHRIGKIMLKVVVFQFCSRAPTCPTPLKSFHKVGLESSLTRSSFPIDSTKPIPLAMVSLDGRQG